MTNVVGDPTPIRDGTIELLVCDWNGTVVDDADRACDATNAVLAALCLPTLDLPAFLDAFSLPLDEFLMDLGVAKDEVPRAVGIWNTAAAAQPARLAFGADELLQMARTLGIPRGVISAASARVVTADAEALGVRHYLDFVMGSVSSKSERLQSLVRQTRGRVLYVGDTEYDVTEALKAGAVPVGVGNGYRPASALLAAGACCVVDDLSVLAGMLAKGPASR